jgi:hypothetical protein
MKMNDELCVSVRALVKRYPLHDVVLAVVHAIDDGGRAGILSGDPGSVTNDTQALLGALGKLSPEALRSGDKRMSIS